MKTASKEELQALGIVKKQCKECCRDISEEEYNRYKGYCRNCYSDRNNIESAKRNFNNDTSEQIEYESDAPKTNTVAKMIKVIAILEGVAGIILGLGCIEDLELYSVVIMVAGFISAVFIYSIGEIIQLLQDIKDKN